VNTTAGVGMAKAGGAPRGLLRTVFVKGKKNQPKKQPKVRSLFSKF